MRGKKVCDLTQESKDKISSSIKKLWEDPEYVEKLMATRKKMYAEGRGIKSHEEREKQKKKQFNDTSKKELPLLIM
jgi:predicted RNA-binding protein with RPS1 domain